MARRRASLWPRRLLTLLIFAALIVGGLAIFRTGPSAEISIEPELPGIGPATPVRVTVGEPTRGLGEVRVEFVQGDRVEMLAADRGTPREFWRFWGPRRESMTFDVVVGSDTLSKLKEGPAAIRVVAARAGTPLRSPNPAVVERELAVKLRPPELQVTSRATYVSQGGAEAVVYRVGSDAVTHGVSAGGWYFAGHPMPGDDGRSFAIFGAPYDLDDGGGIRLEATDAVGNTSRIQFVDRFTARPVRTDTIRLSESLLKKIVPPIMARVPQIEDRGSLLDNYLAVNGELRQMNADELIAFARESRPEFLWSKAFLSGMRNAKVMSDFADRRTYTFDGRAVDQQDHLGFDLASTRAAPILAANDGVVLMARYFGIYGNAVLIDHGYGLMSLYGHLSSIEVGVGQQVERGQTIARSGATGLAGGDHLHFTMLLNGLSVDPREWWDDHWIEDRLKLKLGPALPFDG